MKIQNFFRVNFFRFLVVTVFCLLATLLSTGSEYIAQYAINAISRGDFNRYVWWQVISLIVMIGGALLLVGSAYLFKEQSQDYLLKIRNQLIENFTLNVRKDDLAQIQNQLQNNLETLNENRLSKYFTIFSNALLLLFATGTLLSLHWSLVVLALASAGVNLFLLPKIMQKKTASAVNAVSTRNTAFLESISDWMNGLDVLRRFNLASVLQDQILKKGKRLNESKVSQAKAMSGTNLIAGFGNTLGQNLFAFAAGVLFFQKVISIGGVIVACGFAYTIFSALTEISYAISTVKSTATLNQGVDEALRDHERFQHSVDVASVEGHGLQVKLNEHKWLVYPDFIVEPGEKVLLKGDSGTGKSTLLKLILGTLKPDRGTLILKDSQGKTISNEQARMGYLAQDLFLFPGSLQDNITMFHPMAAKRVTMLLGQVDLTTDVANMAHHLETSLDPDALFLSGGQQQKIVLARSLANQKPLVLMDEPTSAIDRKAAQHIIEQLVRMPNTLIFIGHNLSEETEALFTKTIDLDDRRAEK